jgi:hypothetical protein
MKTFLSLLLAAGCSQQCPPSSCGACPQGTYADDQCTNGQWLCDCKGFDAGVSDGDGGGDGAAVPEIVCTPMACSSDPCMAGCSFVPQVNGACPDMTVAIPKSKALACKGLCGFAAQQGCVYGCLRLRSEDPQCHSCGVWGISSCFEKRPDIDYTTGAAICPDQSFYCAIGCPADLGVPCDRDMASTDGP